VMGNHDLHQPGNKQPWHAPETWRRHFGLPHNGPKGVVELDQQAYYLDYQGVRFLVVDANVFENPKSRIPGRVRIRDAQVSWVANSLKDNPNRWTVVLEHQGMFSIAKNRDYLEMQELLAPLYEKYRVALVLQGHDHSYGRLRKNGVTYVTSVCGPKMYKLESKYVGMMEKTATNMQMYQVVNVDAERITLQAYSLEGKLVDSVEVRK